MGHKERMGLCPDCLLKAGLGSLADETAVVRTVSFDPPPVSEIAERFPQLDLLGLIGCGGMGAVYKARQKALDRLVALKILPPAVSRDPSFAERFAREAKVLAKLSHPNIVTLYEFGESGGLYYFLMDYVDGMNLRQLIRDGRIAPREALAIVPQICDALQCAHDQGIVHRDIKPENILLDRKGRVKVADFGLAKLVAQHDTDDSFIKGRSGTPVSPEITDAGRIMGTPPYMAPEQREHPTEVDHRADIYSLGVVFYQMLTGELPGAKLEPPSKKVVIDVRLDEVVLRALAQKPERRYQQVGDIKTMCATLTQAVPAAERPHGGEAAANVTQADLDRMSRDPANWHFYFIYFCRRDPRIIVPKRITGLGWTVNLGNPWAVPFTVGLIGVALGIIKVAQQAGLTGNALLSFKIAVVVAIVWMCHTLSMARKPSTVLCTDKPGAGTAPIDSTTGAVILLLFLGYLALLGVTASELPERVATHFGFNGQADGWMSRRAYLVFECGFPVFIAGLFAVLSVLVRVLPAWCVNIPRKDYWLAPERRALTGRLLRDWLGWLLGLLTLFFAGLHVLTLQANRAVPPQLPMGGLLLLVIAFFLGLLIWTALLLMRFAETDAAGSSEPLRSAPMPGGTTEKPRRWRKGAIQLLLGVAFALAVKARVLGSYRVSGDALSPEIPGGSYVLAWKPAATFRPSDLIVYRQDGRVLGGRVERSDTASLVVNRNGMPGERIARERVCGRIVTVLWRGNGQTSKKE